MRVAAVETQAMVIDRPHAPLLLRTRSRPEPGPGQVRLRVEACGVCRTDLHVLDGELAQAAYPVVPGHEAVGRVDAVGEGVASLAVGEWVGVPWLAWTCGRCRYCREGRENLCPSAQFTGCSRDGGYATHMLAEAAYCVRLADADAVVDAPRIAPLLCAGLIGWRAYLAAGPVQRLGLFGFGAAAHLLAQVARAQDVQVYAFTRSGDAPTQAFARELGACWAGGSDEAPPVALDAAILFAPVGALVPVALRRVRAGGRVVCAGIHMSDIPSFPYRWLWEERQIVSVANLTRQDARAYFAAIEHIPVESRVTRFRLEDANEALTALRRGELNGAAVLVP